MSGQRVVFITGAASGMGRVQAISLAEADTFVVAVDWRSPNTGGRAYRPLDEDLADLEEAAGAGQVLTVTANVTQQGELEVAAARALDRFGQIDFLVTNAGVSSAYKPRWEFTEDEFVRNIAVNLVDTWCSIKAVVPSMLSRGRRGSIVRIGSGASVKGFPNMAPYVSDKHALLGIRGT